jgi:hypothetical protein
MRTVRSDLFEERRRAKMFADAWRDIGIAHALLKGGESTCQMMCLLQWGRSERMLLVRVIKSVQRLYERHGWPTHDPCPRRKPSVNRLLEIEESR